MRIKIYDKFIKLNIIQLLLWGLYFSYFLKLMTNNLIIFNILQNILLFLISVVAARKWKYKNKNLLFQYFIVLYFVFMIINGIQNYIVFFLGDFTRYSLLFVLFYFNKIEKSYESFTSILHILANTLFFSVPIAVFTALWIGIQPAEFGERFVTASGNENSINPASFLTYSIFLAPFFSIFKTYQKIALLTAMFIVFLMGVLTASRGISALPIIGFLYIIVFNLKGTRIAVLLSIFAFSVMLFLFGNYFFNFNRIINSANFLFHRFTSQDNFSSGRNTESLLYLDSVSKSQLIFGKGLGGANKTWIWESTPHGMSVLHRGYMYQLLKGGIIWTIIYYLLIISVLIKLFNARRMKISYSIIFSLLLILITEISHSVWLNPITLLFLMFTLSFGLNISNAKKQLNLV
jgi:hypothetical protein